MEETINHLERLRAMGYEPFLALLVLFILLLGVGLVGVAGFHTWYVRSVFAKRDKERLQDKLEMEERLSRSEDRHEDCERDREVIHKQMHELDKEVTRLRSCGRKDCPNRLPR